tara:strand:+ start:446 stop:1546 length:1101 start_codon:yes stop_codon:yes gene_type:complete
MNKPKIFIGSSNKGLQVARDVREQLHEIADCTIWNEGVFGLSQGTLEAIVNIEVDYAILVLTPDDLLQKKESQKQAPRDNVIFECGFFIGKIGRERTFMIYDYSSKMDLPSDLAGITLAGYDRSQTSGLVAVGIACNKVRRAINNSLKPKYPRISIIGSTTEDIKKDGIKTQQLIRFYEELLSRIQDGDLGINACGAEPMRTAFLRTYCQKLKNYDKPAIEKYNHRVKWFFHRDDRSDHSLKYEPGYFSSQELSNSTERLLAEVDQSDAILFLAGQTGTLKQLRTLLENYPDRINGKPLILLSWFGGSVKNYVKLYEEPMSNYFERYGHFEPDPRKEVENWWREDKVVELARILVEHIIKTLYVHP